MAGSRPTREVRRRADRSASLISGRVCLSRSYRRRTARRQLLFDSGHGFSSKRQPPQLEAEKQRRGGRRQIEEQSRIRFGSSQNGQEAWLRTVDEVLYLDRKGQGVCRTTAVHEAWHTPFNEGLCANSLGECAGGDSRRSVTEPVVDACGFWSLESRGETGWHHDGEDPLQSR